MSGDAGKRLYESLSAIHAALPDTLQEEFVELAWSLATAGAGDGDRGQENTRTLLRWCRDHGYR